MWGTRVVVPSALQEHVLQELHETHPGMSRMKALARSFVWWPSIDPDIEKAVSSCNTCQSVRSAPPTVQPKSILGFSQIDPGLEFKWILQDPLVEIPI